MHDRSTDYKTLCAGACEVARRAGSYIREQRAGFSYDKVERKGMQNLVSYVDKGAEAMIVAGLRELLPGAGFITEEGTAGHRGQEYRWVVDPLDGTTNFVHGLPPYCVSVALMRGGETVLGAIYEVTLDEMFYAWEGSPAYRNGAQIRTSAVTRIEDALIAVGMHPEDDDTAGFQRRAEYYHRHSNGMRRIGSAAVDLAYVACGRFDAFAQTKLHPWDVAAGALIARRAGAVVTDYAGGGDYVFGRSIVAAAPGVAAEFSGILKNI